MAITKYTFFNNDRNPFKKNERAVPSTFKKGSIIFEENGIGLPPFVSFPQEAESYLLTTENNLLLLDENENTLEIQY